MQRIAEKYNIVAENIDNPKKLAEISEGLGAPMPGKEIATLELRMQERGR